MTQSSIKGISVYVCMAVRRYSEQVYKASRHHTWWEWHQSPQRHTRLWSEAQLSKLADVLMRQDHRPPIWMDSTETEWDEGEQTCPLWVVPLIDEQMRLKGCPFNHWYTHKNTLISSRVWYSSPLMFKDPMKWLLEDSFHSYVNIFPFKTGC